MLECRNCSTTQTCEKCTASRNARLRVMRFNVDRITPLPVHPNDDHVLFVDSRPYATFRDFWAAYAAKRLFERHWPAASGKKINIRSSELIGRTAA